jgi:homoserine dehydrogenase
MQTLFSLRTQALRSRGNLWCHRRAFSDRWSPKIHGQKPAQSQLYPRLPNLDRGMASSSSSSSTIDIAVAVIGTGLVGSEFIHQLLSFPKPNHFHLVSLTSSKLHLFAPDGLKVSEGADWKSQLSQSATKPNIADIHKELEGIVTPGRRVVLVDNTSADEVAALYPEFLKSGINVITPNKKAFSAGLTLYDRILSASLENGSRFYNEATVGAGLPIISTLKDLVATGDKVRTVQSLDYHRMLMTTQVLKIEGVFSGTMSYIFNEFSTGKSDGPSFSSVVRTAREKGYTVCIRTTIPASHTHASSPSHRSPIPATTSTAPTSPES